MNDTLLVYPRERALATLTLILGLIAWLLLIVGTLGIALIYVLFAFIGYVFAQSGFIAWLKGTAVKLSREQHPDLHQRFEDCCKKLNLPQAPEAYILDGNGLLNAFATRFFGRNFVVLFAGVVDALEEEPEGINFYIGHELGHLRMKHLTGRLWRLPVLWLPLLGAAYARAQESTCDLHGRACCTDSQVATRALLVLAAGPRRWKSTNSEQYAQQTVSNNGFWSGFHELINGYPWLSKRVWRVRDPATPVPTRNPFAYALAFFVPYGGRAGGGFLGFVYLVCIIAVLAAIAVPAYQQYTLRTNAEAKLEADSAEALKAWALGAEARESLDAYFVEHQAVPESLQNAGAPEAFPDGRPLHLDTDNMILSVETAAGTLYMVPYIANEKIFWTCQAEEERAEQALPASCRPPKRDDLGIRQ